MDQVRRLPFPLPASPGLRYVAIRVIAGEAGDFVSQIRVGAGVSASRRLRPVR